MDVCLIQTKLALIAEMQILRAGRPLLPWLAEQDVGAINKAKPAELRDRLKAMEEDQLPLVVRSCRVK